MRSKIIRRIRTLSRPDKVVLSLLMAFYAVVLVGFVLEATAISLDVGRAMASPFVRSCS